MISIKKYKIIDAHCHIYPDKIAHKAAAATCDFYEGLGSTLDGTVSTLLKEAELAGIEHCIVQSVATTPKQVSSINKFIALSVAKSEGKFTGFGTLHPDIQKFKIDDYRMLKIYELCEGRLPILIHTGDRRYDFSNPNRMIPILDIYKNLTVIGAHFGGWSIWEEATQKLNKYKNFYVDCSSSLYAINPQKAKELIMIYGTNRVLFGTDYPMWKPEDEVERFMQIELTEKEREDIFYNNAAKLLNI